MRLHFISGLPRSGSTLLAGLLRQNPRFSAAMTGPVGELVGALLNAMGPQNETAVFLDEARRQAILRALFDAYYADQAQKAVVFDTNRTWSARLLLIAALYPQARVLRFPLSRSAGPRPRGFFSVIGRPVIVPSLSCAGLWFGLKD